MIAKRVYFSGRVQGVGFRYTVCQIATHFEIVGWVKNLSNGRVEVQVKGGVQEVAGFIKRICSDHHLSSGISDVDEIAADIQTLNGISEFAVRY